MPKRYAETELILNADKKVYHLNLSASDIADDVIVVGDQDRVQQISSFFQKIEFKTAHREFITHTGIYNNKRITVCSTGIGPDNIDIVLNELDAAVNINPQTRILNENLRSLNIYRLGTSGSLQADIPVNGLVVSNYGIGLDGLLNYYSGLKAINEDAISDAFLSQVDWSSDLPFPYCISASVELLEKFKGNFIQGITATAPGFYGPQGREIRLQPALPLLNEQLARFDFEKQRITNFEMETSALYGLGKMLGHSCITICVIIANRVTKEFTSDYNESVNSLIKNCLERICQ